MNDIITFDKTKEIAVIGILSAVNVASRIVLQGLPNIKPVTSIIILSVLLFGLSFGLKLTFVTTIVSDIFLGLGLWTVFQILSWVVICVLTECVTILFKTRRPNIFFMACFAFVMGYVFGLVVSLEQFVLGGWGLFLPYYLNGLFFDTLHAVGNFGFYLMCAPILLKIKW